MQAQFDGGIQNIEQAIRENLRGGREGEEGVAASGSRGGVSASSSSVSSPDTEEVRKKHGFGFFRFFSGVFFRLSGVSVFELLLGPVYTCERIFLSE